MNGQLIPPSRKDSLSAPKSRKRILGAKRGRASARSVAIARVYSWKFVTSLVLLMLLLAFTFIYITLNQRQERSKSDYELINSIPAGVKEKYKNETIYCWEDNQGKVHYSNIGFPENGEYKPMWIKRN